MLKKQSKFSQILLGTLTASLLISCSNIDKKESSGQYLDSSVITTKVKAELLSDNYVKSLPITVKTYKNVVQLSGFVDNNYQKQRAVSIARSIEGVVDVQDSLVIKSR